MENGTAVILVGLLTAMSGCTAADFVAKGPPGSSPEASIAIYEATIRHYFSAPSKSRSSPTRLIVELECDLDESRRVELIDRLSDMPVDFQPNNDDVTLGRGVKFSIRMAWMNESHAKLNIGHFYGDQGNYYTATVDYKEGAWHFQYSRHVAAVN